MTVYSFSRGNLLKINLLTSYYFVVFFNEVVNLLRFINSHLKLNV
jgi:hypothetical protein